MVRSGGPGGHNYFGDFKKGEVEELRRLLRSKSIQGNQERKRDVLKKVTAYMTMGVDVSRLFSEVVMAAQTPDMVQKKLCYLYLVNCAEFNQELAILAVGTFQRDCRDQNPMIRGLALRTMASIRLPNVVEYLAQPLNDGLKDTNAYVRKTAVVGCIKLFHMVPSLVHDAGIVDKLYDMLRDRDSTVVVNAVVALEDILAETGGISLTQQLAVHLLAKLPECNPWAQCIIMDVLCKYTPTSEDEIFDIMNVLEARLSSSNSAVVLAAVKVFLRVTADMPDIQASVFARVKEPLITLMRGAGPEIAYTLLLHMQLLAWRHPDIFAADAKHFFVRAHDPAYVSEVKMSVMARVATEATADEIIDELSEYVRGTNVSQSLCALRAIGEVCSRAPSVVPRAASAINRFLVASQATGNNDILDGAVRIASQLLHRFPRQSVNLVEPLAHAYGRVSKPESKAAMIWVLGEFGDQIDRAPYILEAVVDAYDEETEPCVRLALLTAVVKLFFKRPPECHAVLGRLLAAAVSDVTHADVHDRALLYHRLLMHNVGEAARVVTSPMPAVTLYAEEESSDVKDRLFDEFNSLSVLYGKPSELFIVPSFQLPLMGAEDLAAPAAPVPAVPSSVSDGVVLIDASVTAETFQEKWTGLPVAQAMSLAVTRVPDTPALEQALKQRLIFTMASGTVGQEMKLYVYATDAAGGVLLAELLYDLAAMQASFSLRCDNPDAGPWFAQLLQHVVSSM